MTITEETLEIIYERAVQFAIAKYGSEPNHLKLYENYISAVWYVGCCGDHEEETEVINPSDLTADLDKVAAERREAERLKAIKQAELNKQREEQYKKDQLERRKQEYLKLKKEFE